VESHNSDVWWASEEEVLDVGDRVEMGGGTGDVLGGVWMRGW